MRKKLKDVNWKKRIAEARFRTQKNGILNNLSFLEKTCLISLLNQEFERFAHPHILTHKKKLFNYLVLINRIFNLHLLQK